MKLNTSTYFLYAWFVWNRKL